MIRPTGKTNGTLVVAALCILNCGTGFAQDLQLDAGANGMYLRLKSMQKPVSVLHVVAHPDDEDGGMLAYCARELGARTMLFSLTRGEGGANLISSHFFDELGALRTLEHLKAASYYGNELFYSRAADYGYSKTLKEAMGQWQSGVPLLEDLVEVIRRERPTILLSRFAGDARDGHGHHQMAGVLSRQAIAAAADASQFPQQIRDGLQPWQIKKFYVRSGSPWRPPKEGDWTIALPIGKHDPVLGLSPAQIARFGLGFQRSQGMSGHAADAGPKSSYYRLEKSAVGEVPEIEASLFAGLDASWSGLVEPTGDSDSRTKNYLRTIDVAVASILHAWNPREPAATCRSLIDLRKKLDSAPEMPETLRGDITRLRNQVDEAILHSSGVELVAWATDAEDKSMNRATPGDQLKVNVRLANLGAFDVNVRTVSIGWPGGNQQFKLDEAKLAPGTVAEFAGTLELPRDVAVTRPHWSRADIAEPMYRVDAGGKQRPTPDSGLQAATEVSLEAVNLAMAEPLETRRNDPEFGNVRYPLVIVPDKSVQFALGNRVVPKHSSTFSTSVKVRSTSKGKSNALVRLETPKGWSCEPSIRKITFDREDQESSAVFQVSLANAEARAYEIRAVVESDAGEFREGFETITARQLGRVTVYHDAVQHVQIVDAKVLGQPKVGYISGSGDRVAESLAPLGIVPTFLSEADLASSDLSEFDVVLVGVRAYAVREDVRTHNSRLLGYVKQGGVLIVQYQTPEFDYNFGPYPYEMGRGPEEVSEELAEVTLLHPKHPVFQIPNVISPRDFDGWFEQRGSKFWRTWDDRYTPLLECHDTAQPKQEGGQLIAQYGNGVYVYSAYAWYRQLPKGVPGAYRLFANLLSLPETDLVK